MAWRKPFCLMPSNWAGAWLAHENTGTDWPMESVKKCLSDLENIVYGPNKPNAVLSLVSSALYSSRTKWLGTSHFVWYHQTGRGHGLCPLNIGLGPWTCALGLYLSWTLLRLRPGNLILASHQIVDQSKFAVSVSKFDTLSNSVCNATFENSLLVNILST